MKQTNVVTVIASVLLAAACGGSDGDVVKESSPTTPTSASSSGAPPASSSGGSSSSGSSTSSSSSGATPDAAAPPGGNCVPKGYAGNEKKIGAYCDKDVSCPFQVDPFLVCTATYDPTGTHSFCTAPCSKDEECGTGATCVHDKQGSGCVPTQCAN